MNLQLDYARDDFLNEKKSEASDTQRPTNSGIRIQDLSDSNESSSYYNIEAVLADSIELLQLEMPERWESFCLTAPDCLCILNKTHKRLFQLETV